MRHLTTRIAYLFAVAIGSSGSANAVVAQQMKASPTVVDLFTGRWREDLSRRDIRSVQDLIFKEDAEGLTEVRGSEARPLVQRVVFDDKPYDLPGPNAIRWKRLDSTHFERRLINRSTGAVINTRRITLSADGSRLTEEFEQKTPAGELMVETTVFKRLSGSGTGLAARWKAESVTNSKPDEIEFSAAGANSLNFSDSFGRHYVLPLTNATVVIQGPTVIEGTTIAGRQVNGRTIETVIARHGVETERRTLQISDDGRELTIVTVRPVTGGSTESAKVVYVRQ